MAKRKWRVMRWRKDDPAWNLQAAVVKFVKSRGGRVLVVGGIGVEEHGGYNFSVSVRCTGAKPVKKEGE